MRRRTAFAVLVAAVAAPGALAQAVDETVFRYERPLVASPGLARFEPDGVLFAHTKPGLVDLRILDSDGRQVPWRPFETVALEPAPQPVSVLNRGTRGGRAVALLDLGRRPGPHDRIELDIPASDFVGRVVVSGSDARGGRFTRLSTTVVYDVTGAVPARSTTVVYPRSDFRYLQLEATGVPAIAGAAVPGALPEPEQLLMRELRALDVSQSGRRTVLVADLGFPKLPVDRLQVSSTTELYDRPVTIEGSNERVRWTLLAQGRVFRFPDSVETALPLAAAHRYLRITIDNGDDAPLAGLGLELLARSRAVVLADGYAPPYRLLYGNPSAQAPEYDFAQAPASSLELEGAATARFGAEALNNEYEPPEDTRSFFARNPWVVQMTLALVAAVLVVGGVLALRRRA